MPSRGSRYRAVAEVVRTDASGRTSPAVELRRRAPVEGVVSHVVTADDRLDGLAQRYYGKPRRWWRIVDANPEVLFPLALLGRDTVATVTIAITRPDGHEWYRVVTAVAELVGVEDVAISLPAPEEPDGSVRSARLAVRLNTASLAPDAVLAAVRTAGFAGGPPELRRRLGATIRVPTEGRT